LELVRDSPPPDPGAASELHAPPLEPAGRRKGTMDRRQEQELLASLGPLRAPEPGGERRLPWLLDIVLYPMSLSGVIGLLVIAISPLLVEIIPWSLFFAIGGNIWLNVGIGLYAVWYLAECVYDSAKGGTRAPDVLDADTRPSELASRFAYLLAVYILFILPSVIYWICVGRVDVIFCGLVAWAIVFFPMGLLAMVINDSSCVLNPLFLLGAILRVLFAYVGLLLLIAALVALFILFAYRLMLVRLGVLGLLFGAYASLVMAHVLGRFYWRYRDKLDWGI
jgi:hypothetical protein